MLGRFARVGAFWAPSLSLSLGLPCVAAAPAPGLGRSSVRLCPLAAVSCALALPPRMSRSEQLRQLAVQLASLASVEDAVEHGLQSLLESLSGRVAPLTAAERALPASLSRPRSRSRSLTPVCSQPPWVDPAQPARSHRPGRTRESAEGYSWDEVSIGTQMLCEQYTAPRKYHVPHAFFLVVCTWLKMIDVFSDCGLRVS